ncbi:retrotransposon protein, putative, ty1-copia subclass [Tanacetum coccineum]
MLHQQVTLSESDKWVEDMNAKMQSMRDNQVWCLVDPPPDGRTVGSKWLFKKNTDMDGKVHTFKARLVAKGYTQTYSVDYGETFSPIIDIRAIRILIAITALKVCKLQRSIYGLKQASRSWNKRFDEEIKKYGFTQNLDEPCVYQKASGSIVTFLILYVDDILIIGNNIPILQDVKSWLDGKFQPGNIPMQEIPNLSKAQGASKLEEVSRMQRVPYASTIGSIMYAVRCTKPDVAFVQNLTSRFQQNPGESHWTAVKTILNYDHWVILEWLMRKNT